VFPTLPTISIFISIHIKPTGFGKFENFGISHNVRDRDKNKATKRPIIKRISSLVIGSSSPSNQQFHTSHTYTLILMIFPPIFLLLPLWFRSNQSSPQFWRKDNSRLQQSIDKVSSVLCVYECIIDQKMTSVKCLCSSLRSVLMTL